MVPAKDVTQMLVDGSQGHPEALDRLLPLVYDELRRLARRYLRRERPDHTLQATALVHEAYLRLVDQTKVNCQTRTQFFGIAAHLMRQILVNHAIRHQRAKREGAVYKLSLDEAMGLSVTSDMDLVALHDALDRLAALDAQQSRIVELRFFGGLTVEEIADVLGVSARTVKRDWRMAKAWLHSEINKGK